MFSTKPLSSISRFLKQPIALTPRESQKLLKSITSSFRRNLDREHGFEPDEPAHADASDAVTSSSSSGSQRTSLRHESTMPTDEHIRTVLANPLLNYHKQPDPAPQRAQKLPPRRDSRRGPVDVFDQAVAKGMMTLRAATGCMVAVRSAAKVEPRPSSRLPAQALMGRRVLDWLRSSGQESTLGFLAQTEDSVAFIRVLMHFLLAEGLEGKVWEWIDRLIALEVATGEEHSDAGERARLLIDRLVVTKYAHSPSTINSTIEDVARVDEKLARNPGLGYIMYPAWSYLARLLTRPSRQPRPQVSATGFDTLLGLGRHINDLRASILSAHLQLHHPTAPTCEPAMQVLRTSPGLMERLAEKMQGNGKQDGLAEAATIALAKDTLAYLVKAGQDAEAKSLSRYMGLHAEGEASQTLA